MAILANGINGLVIFVKAIMGIDPVKFFFDHWLRRRCRSANKGLKTMGGA